MGILKKNLYMDINNVKRCRFLGKVYPSECDNCKHHISIFCGCDYEEYNGEGCGLE